MRCPHDHRAVPVRGSYGVTAMCLRATAGWPTVRHSHVILTIRNTHIFSKHPSTQVKKTYCASRIHYIAKNGTQRSYPSLVSSFICMFHLFMKFRHLRVYSCQPCFFRVYGTHTRPSASQNMTKLNKSGLRKQ